MATKKKKPAAKKAAVTKPVAKQATANKPQVASPSVQAQAKKETASSPFAGSSPFFGANSNTVKDFVSAGSQEARRAQERAFSFGRDHMEKWMSGSDKTARGLGEAFAVSKDGVDALVEYSKIATELSKDFQQEVTAEWNELCTETVENAKDLLACRTLNDYVELQNRLLQQNVNRLVSQGARVTDLWFKLTTEAAEPINSQVNRTTSRINKALVA